MHGLRSYTHATQSKLKQGTQDCCSNLREGSRQNLGGGGASSKNLQVPRLACSSKPLKRSENLGVLSVLPALYGLGNVVSSSVDKTTISEGAETGTCFIKYTSASVVFLPVLVRCVKEQDHQHLRSGAELGLWTFAHSIVSVFSSASSGPTPASLLYVLTALLIPVLQIFARRSCAVRCLANFLPLLGMGILEEEGNGWNSILPTSCENWWTLIDAAFSIFQMLRSESLNRGRDPAKLQAVQLAVLSALSLLWQITHLSSKPGGSSGLSSWLVVAASGLVCSGLTSLLEIRGLRGVDSSSVTISYMTVPLWGALFSSILRGRALSEEGSLILLLFVFTRFRIYASSRRRCRSDGGDDGEEDHLPAVILSSQLKFPYYTSQAEALVATAGSDTAGLVDFVQALVHFVR